MYTGLYIFLGIISLSVAYNIRTNVTDGVPDYLNITTSPFQKIGDHYYYINTANKANWYAASLACAELDAKLIDFESLEEWQWVINYLNDTNDKNIYWTSGANLADEIGHFWFSNGKTISFNIWLPEEPNNKNNEENCDEIHPRNKYGIGLNDRKCTFETYYICKAQQPKTASVIVW